MRSFKRIGIGMIIVSAFCMVLSFIQKPAVTTIVPFSTNGTDGGELTLTIPSDLRTGDNEIIILNVSYTASTLQNLELISRLELGGIEINPTGEVRGLMGQDGTVRFKWKLRSSRAQSIHAILWLYYENKSNERQLLFARPIELESVALLGISYPTIRWFSGIGLVLGIGLMFARCLRKTK
jgi:hypothetical protein